MIVDYYEKTLLVLAIASIGTSAFAVDTSSQNSKNDDMFTFNTMHKDQFSISGSVGVGGYYDSGSNAFYDDSATGLTLAVNYRNNHIVGYFETDFMLNYTTDSKTQAASSTEKNSSPAADIDKAWLGFDTGFGVISYGWENDTALDDVDGAGDFTYEFGASAGDAGDAFNVVKFQGSTSGFAYGVSYFETDDVHVDAEKGVNGYVGIEQEIFNVYVGYELRDKATRTLRKNVSAVDADYEVITVTGNTKFGEMNFGANFWIEDMRGKSLNKTNTGYYLSVGYALSEYLTLAAGYAANTDEVSGLKDLEQSYMNISIVYVMAKNIDMGFDIQQGIDSGYNNVDEETHLFVSAFYYF